jgi:hypothetical protein
MKSHRPWFAASTVQRCLPVLLAVTTCGAAWAQSPDAEPAAPPAALDETARVAEQVRILKSLHAVQLNRDQTQALLDILKPGRQRLEQQEQAHARQLAAVIPALRQATIPAGAAPGQLTPGEMEYARVRQVDRQIQETLRNQLRTSLRAALDKLLTPAQRAALATAGSSAYMQQRLGQSAAGYGGSVEAVARTLDQLRQADAARYPSERQQFALRSAEIANARQLMQRGGPGGQDGGGRNRSGPGGDNFRRGDRGRSGAEGAAQAQQLQQQLNDPAVQARLRDYLALADQVRRMPAATYQQRRSHLALQLWSAREERRLQSDPQRSTEAFIDQVLLAPAAVEVLELKIKSATG